VLRLLTGLLLASLLVAFGASAQAQEQIGLPSAVAERLVDSLSHAYYENKFALYPELATAKGVSGHDSALATFDPREVRRFIIQTKRAQEKLASFIEDSLDIETWVDSKALASDMATQLFFIEDLGISRKNPTLYVDACTNGLYYLALRRENLWEDPDFRARLERIPKVLEGARTNLTEPTGLQCEVAAASARGFLPFLQDLKWHGGRNEADFDAAIERAVASLQGFAAYLDSVGPSANPDFALGYDNLVNLLGLRHMIEDSPEEIVAYAERLLRNAGSRLAAMEAPPPPAAVDTARALVMTREDILGLYATEADSALAFLERKDLVTVPEDAPVRVIASPAFLRTLVAGYAYEPPGPFDDLQAGHLYVPLADSLDAAARIKYATAATNRKLRGVIVHEIYPGHHLQIVAGNRHPSFVRRLQLDTFTAEGWALYCEEMMADAGYYGDQGERGVLRGVVFRAARAVVDVRLQTGEFTLREAADFMVSQTGLDRDYIESEVRRYAVDPAQPMSYIMGKKAVMDLRDRLKQIRGASFDLKEFHDMLLACGPVQPYLVRVCVTSRAIGRK
jgi:hypothetical protein